MNNLYKFFAQYSVYIVMIIVVVIWIAIFFFTVSLDTKIAKLAKIVKDIMKNKK